MPSSLSVTGELSPIKHTLLPWLRAVSSSCRFARQGLLATIGILAGCAGVAPPPSAPPTSTPTAPAVSSQTGTAPVLGTPQRQLVPISWAALPGWQDDDLSEFASAWEAQCAVVGQREGRFATPDWRRLCELARSQGLNATSDGSRWRQFIETHFTPQRVELVTTTESGSATPEKQTQGLITGYYEPLYQGSLQPTASHSTALYGVPPDLIQVELSTVYPALKGQRVRGRLLTLPNGRQQLVPYFSRAEFAARRHAPPYAGRELVWLDPVDAFFIEVQGSGRVRLPDGKILRVGYAEQNGHPYKSIGRWLVEQGELNLEQATAQGIRDWAARYPGRRQELLNANPSLVFFRELTTLKPEQGPLGSLGVPLVAQRSVAIDPSFIPLGALLFVNTTLPATQKPLQRLMLAQDTGGAIRGAIRADYFWGTGPAAGEQAGKMRQAGELYWLVPKTERP
ncbi:murein transglycosylase A [Parvibium lacunae]|uniref:peptidoglycan lytic exotransglycosylase n=1 Tax=Parvibium lacunae TaxID=1888893 RepID=A0A368L511_9BURK|nr:MltA domain-containing protein [Parvibium lacunae]RCS58605.1 murein transglycosylase [Parvibium lacunae]